jgi:SAM-dependent methyltransferase
MDALRARWSALIDRQHRLPSGPIGQIIGQRMGIQHAPETGWSTDLLGLAPTDRVLEIGFGAGLALAQIMRRVEQGWAVGVDRSPAMIRAAAWRNRAAIRRGRLRLLRCDLAHLPFGTGQFDKILSIHTFYFWPDAHALCLQLSTMLAPGGRLVITFATAQTLVSGERIWWPIQGQAEALVDQLGQHPSIGAALQIGPDSRQFNNVAIVVDRRASLAPA